MEYRTSSHHTRSLTQQPKVSRRTGTFSSRSQSYPNEVFVGNLSYFCDETCLFNLFQEYSNVVNVRIVRTEDRSRSLLFGFIAFTTPEEVIEMTRLMNNHLFMGRNMKVEASDRKTNTRPEIVSGAQIHIAISSNFQSQQIIKPTETLLRKYFLRYGSIVDLQVNVYFSHHVGRQEGYAFLTFAEESSAHSAITAISHHVDGLTMVCTKPQRNDGRSNGKTSQMPVLLSAYHNMPAQPSMRLRSQPHHHQHDMNHHQLNHQLSSVSAPFTRLNSPGSHWSPFNGNVISMDGIFSRNQQSSLPMPKPFLHESSPNLLACTNSLSSSMETDNEMWSDDSSSSDRAW